MLARGCLRGWRLRHGGLRGFTALVHADDAAVAVVVLVVVAERLDLVERPWELERGGVGKL